MPPTQCAVASSYEARQRHAQSYDGDSDSLVGRKAKCHALPLAENALYLWTSHPATRSDGGAAYFFAQNMLQGTRFQLWSFNARLTQHPNSPAAKGKQIIFEEIGPSGSVVRKHLQQQIAGLETRGGTNLYQAIFEALRYFQSPSYQVPEANVKRFPVVVLLADGQDDGYSAINRSQVLQKRKQVEEVEVKVIGFGITPNSETHRQLCELARPAADCLVTSSPTELQTLIRSFTRS